MRSHGWYDLPPFPYDEDARTLATRLPSGAVTFRERDGALEATASGRGVPRAELLRAARRVFSLDLDLAACAGIFAGEPALARGLARGGGRMLRAPGLFEDAVKMLFTTNCSWAATRGMVVRLIDLAGGESGAFPTPAAIARIPPARLKSRVRCGYRAVALSRFAKRVDSGRLDLSGWERPEATVVRRARRDPRRARLRAVRRGRPAPRPRPARLPGPRLVGSASATASSTPGPRRSVDRAIARRYARYGEYRGLALWLEMTQHWHEGSPESKARWVLRTIRRTTALPNFDARH